MHRGLLWDHYGYKERKDNEVVPIIDSAYVLLDFTSRNGMLGNINASETLRKSSIHQSTLGCLELCMFAEGSRHQEEIVVTGMKGRIEGEFLIQLFTCTFVVNARLKMLSSNTYSTQRTFLKTRSISINVQLPVVYGKIEVSHLRKNLSQKKYLIAPTFAMCMILQMISQLCTLDITIPALPLNGSICWMQ